MTGPCPWKRFVIWQVIDKVDITCRRHREFAILLCAFCLCAFVPVYDRWDISPAFFSLSNTELVFVHSVLAQVLTLATQRESCARHLKGKVLATE